MKKLAAILALTAIFGLSSCGPTTTSEPTTPPTSNPTSEEDTKYNFEVSVEYENGDPFVGARVQACNVDGTTCFMPVTTDEEGKCVLKLDLGEYVVHVLNVPEGYYYDEDGYIISETNSSVNIVLYAEQVARQW